jgi:hypothetical protein
VSFLAPLSKIPLLWWVVIGLLFWGGAHRYRAIHAVQELRDASSKAQIEHDAKVERDHIESERRVNAQKENARVSQAKAKAAAVEAAAASAAHDELRRRYDQAEAQRGADHSSSERGCASAEARTSLYAGLFFEASEFAVGVAAEAERYRTAGERCEADYTSLTR